MMTFTRKLTSGLASILVYGKFGLLKHDKDIISIAATGVGKSLTFWMPLLFDKGGIQVVVTPLNILGDQNINDLKARGVSGTAISAENATKQNFEVNPYLNLIITRGTRWVV